MLRVCFNGKISHRPYMSKGEYWLGFPYHQFDSYNVYHWNTHSPCSALIYMELVFRKRTLDFRICTALTNQNFFLKFVSTSYHVINHFSLQRSRLIHFSKWGPCTVDNNTWQADIEVTRCGLGRRYSTTYWSTLLEFSSQCTGMECIFLTIYNQWYHSVLPFNLSKITKLSRLVMLIFFKQKYIFAFLSFPKFEVAQIIKILLSRSRVFLPV